MIPSSSGRESEGQIATSLSLSLLLLPLSLLLSGFSTSHFSFPLWHVSVYSPFRVSPFGLYHSISVSPRPSTSLRSAPSSSHSPPPPPSLPPLQFYSLVSIYSFRPRTHTHTHTHTHMHARLRTHLSYTSPPCLRWWHQKHAHTSITSIFGFSSSHRRTHRHKNTYRLHYTSRPEEFDTPLRTRWVWGIVPADK